MYFSLQKPARGTALRERRQRKADADAHEKREKAKVRARDRQCRWPGCSCKTLRLPLEVSHVVAKSLGGSSDADQMILMCCERHRGTPSLHSGDLEVRPQTKRGTDGPCDFMELREDGRWDCVGSERTWRVSVPRGNR